ISDYTTAEVEEGSDGLTFVDNRPAVEGYKETKQDEISREFESIFNFMKINLNETPLKITLAGNLECASGIGASAALASSIARALSEHFSLGLNDDQINEIAYEGERGGSGTPSGIDNTCSTYGGMIVFEKNLSGGPNKIQRIEVSKPLEIVMASTGITQETKEVVADVKKEKEKDPVKFDKIFTEYKKLFDEALISLNKGDIKNIGMLMDKNQELLRQITVSCPEVEKIIEIAKKNGALGAKLTGTGRGGLVICLSPDSGTTEKISEAIEKEDFTTSKTLLGKK
ncbi:MAG: mevalonate kinase, partial [Candidatus Aenigmarchaeota archaeon]|nr:mevalonate kinase [Candidatus Aenigmarchaeota archaeon]